MPGTPNTLTSNVSLVLATKLTKQVNDEWSNGSFIEKVNPVTAELLRFWFCEPYTINRDFNFHDGQRQAILNTIYAHEILKIRSVRSLYETVDVTLLSHFKSETLEGAKNAHPKYCLKLATGTGKTWVMHALLIWQYLNAIEKQEGFSKNFLLVAPGLIVYERLLDAYLGKEDAGGNRDFVRSDFVQFKDLFIPPSYRENLFSFIENAACKKDDIGRRVTGGGLIAITNWHLFLTDEKESDTIDVSDTVRALRPLIPGNSGGNALDQLDKAFLSGNELRFLTALPDLVVFNDEAHHIHDIKKGEETDEVLWQKALVLIASKKGPHFTQIDFSATPYSTTGAGRTRRKHYFEHIIVDYDLGKAVTAGHVKLIAIDKRKEFGAGPLDFKSKREGGDVVSLSEGQRTMLRAGLSKLNKLDSDFRKIDDSKCPKMLIVIENTSVAPRVEEALLAEGLSPDDILTIHSNKRNEITALEWKQLKQRLFSIDKHRQPRVIISVLMLREGFDVNNICVIVPLRSSEQPILLEQIIGRGLRLMWREPVYSSLKDENRKVLLEDRNREPVTYQDMLFIVEHPAYINFYEDLEENRGILIEEVQEVKEGLGTGDLELVSLRDDYAALDLFVPIILQDSEELLNIREIDFSDLVPIETPLDTVKALVGSGGEVFYSEEFTKKTRFGEYRVTGTLFNATSYQDYISKMVSAVTSVYSAPSRRGADPRLYPTIQIDKAFLAAAIDQYIRTRLFNQPFNPLVDDNWHVLKVAQSKVIEHILIQLAQKIHRAQTTMVSSDALVEPHWFSEIGPLRMRRSYSMPVSKCIYPRMRFPSNKGGFERAFMEAIDRDTSVFSFMKIDEHDHKFARILYWRDDGALAPYTPDFIVKSAENIFIVETKAENQLKNPNVQKKRIATAEFCDRVNKLQPIQRDNRVWVYCLLGEKDFYENIEKGASILDILRMTQLSVGRLEGKLNAFFPK